MSETNIRREPKLERVGFAADAHEEGYVVSGALVTVTRTAVDAPSGQDVEAYLVTIATDTGYVELMTPTGWASTETWGERDARVDAFWDKLKDGTP